MHAYQVPPRGTDPRFTSVTWGKQQHAAILAQRELFVWACWTDGVPCQTPASAVSV